MEKKKKKGSLVPKRQHKHWRGGNYIGAKLVVCLGEEIKNKKSETRKSPVLKSVGNVLTKLTLRKWNDEM